MPVQIKIPPVPGVPVAAAAYAARLTTGALRHGLNDREFAPLVPTQARAWRRMQPADCVRAAVVGCLVKHGFTVPEAVAIVIEQLDPHIEAVIEILADIPWPFLRGRLHGVTVKTSRSKFARLTIDVAAICADVEGRLQAFKSVAPLHGSGAVVRLPGAG